MRTRNTPCLCYGFLSAQPSGAASSSMRRCFHAGLRFVRGNPGMFAGRWWTMVLRGIVTILFAVLAFAWPGETLGILMLLFGCYALLDGLCMLIAAMGGRPRR